MNKPISLFNLSINFYSRIMFKHGTRAICRLYSFTPGAIAISWKYSNLLVVCLFFVLFSNGRQILQVSDDEDDTHPNIDTPSLFKWRHEARIQRMEELEQKKKDAENLKKK